MKYGWGAITMAAEGYYKAGKNAWNYFKKKKEQNEAAEKWAEQEKYRKEREKFLADPNVDPRYKVTGGTATYGMVQVWDPKLGRKKWVSDMDAYYAKMEKEGRDPVSGQPIEYLEKIQKENEEKKKQEELKLEEEKIKEDTKSKKQEIPAVGTEARKKYYDSKNWKYDDTIKGYNKDGTEKKNEVEVKEPKAKEEVVVENNKKKNRKRDKKKKIRNFRYNF
tara:strand:- start:277 stop:939 length:663 start_codon:yes stop_codon:yes gene_type:complete